ncbi:MAG: ATP-binding domain-containing protein, partial [Clostridia bacterium]|nr:ATP-binding domain-containing protein [Clostridia bacterium]
MTVHAAKGLEFPVVFLAGMEDGIFPSQQNIGEADQMSEERRLAYVAITRAKERLFVTHAKSRMMYGKTGCNPLSRFAREIPPFLVEHDRPRTAPPRQSVYQQRNDYRRDQTADLTELRRPTGFSRTNTVKRTGAKAFGIEKLAPGTRVTHEFFGNGEILSSRDMGGDVLYEVAFDNGQVKKLMATFAKLRRI